MAAIKSGNTKPEIAVRRIVWSLGVRYRLHRKEIPGKPDLAFIGRRKVIFVHGCFWHQHEAPNCKLSHAPKSRISYWEPKLRKNKERDAKHIETLTTSGWDVLVVWECQTKRLETLEPLLRDFLGV
jgi:DNA mismatch endonuclease, patch repair protein